VFRLESAQLKRKSYGNGSYSESVEGTIRMVQVLKGNAASYKTVTYSTALCGGIRLEIGHYFLVATRERSASIELGPSSESLIDVTMFFNTLTGRISPDDSVLRPIFDFAAGKPLPRSYSPPDIMLLGVRPPVVVSELFKR
jgi:hypothetical protein